VLLVANVLKEREKMSAYDARRELLPGQSAALLQDLHLLTRDGQLNADARRKLKQINHLAGLLQPLLRPLFAKNDPLVIDAGAGNAYLGFVLYELWCSGSGRGAVWSVEAQADLVARGLERAARLGYDRMRFLHEPVAAVVERVANSQLDGRPVDAVVALHACDTATDDAIKLGLATQAPVIALVPCCQAEVARSLSGSDAGRRALGPLWRHGLHRREFGAHLTNVLRSLVLEAAGYEITVTELVGWEHAVKNELILARKIQRGNPMAQKQLDALIASLPPFQMRLLTSPPVAPLT
jgi:hypothetical protein